MKTNLFVDGQSVQPAHPSCTPGVRSLWAQVRSKALGEVSTGAGRPNHVPWDA